MREDSIVKRLKFRYACRATARGGKFRGGRIGEKRKLKSIKANKEEKFFEKAAEQ